MPANGLHPKTLKFILCPGSCPHEPESSNLSQSNAINKFARRLLVLVCTNRKALIRRLLVREDTNQGGGHEPWRRGCISINGFPFSLLN
jgi:hypothetical protein